MREFVYIESYMNSYMIPLAQKDHSILENCFSNQKVRQSSSTSNISNCLSARAERRSGLGNRLASGRAGADLASWEIELKTATVFFQAGQTVDHGYSMGRAENTAGLKKT